MNKFKYRKKIRYFLLNFFLVIVTCSYSQIPLPQNYEQRHPRALKNAGTKEDVLKRIQSDNLLQQEIESMKRQVDEHVIRHQSEPEWIVSRLQMYWKSHATDVFINGIFASHAGGKRAPVPTVRHSGARDATTNMARPNLKDVLPYMEDEKGLYLINRETKQLEWVHPSKSGRIIEDINNEILGLAQTSAYLYWINHEEKYAKFAFDIFDTYVKGLYYRSIPIDISNSHIQTIVALTSFETIQERAASTVSSIYDIMFDYLQENGNIDIYSATLKKWVDVIIQNGVPHNNWNLIQARNILNIALILEDDEKYEDRKGRQYYINYVLNKDSERQWSINKLIAFGYDFETGIWAECPGYNQTGSFAGLIGFFETNFDYDLLPYMSVLEKAVLAQPQYAFPNGYITAFGDTRYRSAGIGGALELARNAQKYGKKEQEEVFTKLYKLYNGELRSAGRSRGFASFFSEAPNTLNPNIPAGKMEDYITSTFYAPNVSWFVQRNNYTDPVNGMMISQYGSLGNHMHANGVSIELYGKGYVLGAESGIGRSYFQPDYAEYYSQFPAHNTVMVDGISSYPVMKSHQAFTLLSHFPKSGQKTGYYPDITYSDVYFLEPETRADQNRLLSIVRTGATTGYYVDIFRSRRQQKGDRYHDYFYHNLGQELSLTDTKGNMLILEPTKGLSFAGANLFAFDYIWDKRFIKTGDDFRAQWKMSVQDGNHIYMNLWMQGFPDREIYSVKCPPANSYLGNTSLPYDAGKEPFLTIVARQYGEAWKRPFVTVFEPFTEREGSSIVSIAGFESENKTTDFVGITLIHNNNRTDHVFSCGENREEAVYKDMSATATYAVITEEANGDMVLFMGNGTALSRNNFKIESTSPTNAVLEKKNNCWYYSSDFPTTIIMPSGVTSILVSGKEYRGTVIDQGISFQLPAIEYNEIFVK